MLQQIHIQNFRCFENFKAEGFERINLIGGKNNSGKSCLLEGIFAAINPHLIEKIADLRNEKPCDLLKRKDYKAEINFEFSFLDLLYTHSLSIDYSNKIQSFFSRDWNLIFSKLIATTKEIPTIDTSKIEISDFVKIKPELIKVLKIIDSNINDLKIFFNKDSITYKIVSNSTEINRELNLTSFGEATKSILQFFTPIIEKIVRKNNTLSILLIDEIENGIHYTAHEEFWQHLFKLCKELNVQVFATTHSLEMIKAFNAVALKEGEGAYFEMMRDEATNNIEILKHSPEILEEELEIKNAKFRGEVYKKSIDLATDLMETLNQASAQAKEKLKANGLAVPFIEDGWIWQLSANGERTKIEKLEALKQ